MTQSTEPAKSAPPDIPPLAQSGEPFSEAQIRMLRLAVIGMGVLMIVGIVALIGRIAYLARANSAASTATMPSSQRLVAEARAILPKGATLKTTALSGDRLVVSYADATGDGVLIVDLTTGHAVSHVRIERTP
jgi:Family of unknown function (DUF6476)